MNDDDINDYIPSVLNPRHSRKQSGDFTFTQASCVSRCSLSLRRNNLLKPKKTCPENKENNSQQQQIKNKALNINCASVVKSNTIADLNTEDQDLLNDPASPEPVHKILKPKSRERLDSNEGVQLASLNSTTALDNTFADLNKKDQDCFIDPVTAEQHKILNSPKSNRRDSLKSSEGVQLESLNPTPTTVQIFEEKLPEENNNKLFCKKPVVTVSCGLVNCEKIDVTTKHVNIQKMTVSHNNGNISFECEIIESSQLSTLASTLPETSENIMEKNGSPQKRSAVTVNLEIKKQKLTNEVGDSAENYKVLILNTDAIEKVSHVIVQPPNYKLVQQPNNNNKYNLKSPRKTLTRRKNGKISASYDKLKQKSIDVYFTKTRSDKTVLQESILLTKSYQNDDTAAINLECDNGQAMNRSPGTGDSVKCDRTLKSASKGKETNILGRPLTCPTKGDSASSSKHNPLRAPSSEARRSSSLISKNNSLNSSPRKNVDSLLFPLPSQTSKCSNNSKTIPYYKIVAGTHFAVDAFCYGDIPNVKHYFLTHFHSDHYAGLKKSFNKLLFCSKITGDLCTSRLGVNSKCIHVIDVNATVRIDGVEVTAVEANHCPGAIMLVFTLPNGKTILHTGDFRACPAMESYPVFWNKDIHTIYLDTTYCNPRYDFPTQDQSLEMAMYQLRQKKIALEKVNKKFSSVLIVCGTYTIGKEKFFLGIARWVGCSVWAAPEKDRVLQVVEGRSFSHAPPHSCQLHVVPMRELTIEKLSTYLRNLQGAFSEVVAFKPSGWENGRNSTIEKDQVTIHGIPYSEHSSFSEMIRFTKFLKPKQVVPTVDISGGVKAVQKFFACPLVCKEESHSQSKVTDFFSIHSRQQVPAVT